MATAKTKKTKEDKKDNDKKRTVCPRRKIIVTPAFLDKDQKVILPPQIFQSEES